MWLSLLPAWVNFGKSVVLFLIVQWEKRGVKIIAFLSIEVRAQVMILARSLDAALK